MSAANDSEPEAGDGSLNSVTEAIRRSVDHPNFQGLYPSKNVFELDQLPELSKQDPGQNLNRSEALNIAAAAAVTAALHRDAASRALGNAVAAIHAAARS